MTDEFPTPSPDAPGAHPCGHADMIPGCGGCDPGAIEFVRDDGGPWVRVPDAPGAGNEPHSAWFCNKDHDHGAPGAAAKQVARIRDAGNNAVIDYELSQYEEHP